MNATYFKQFKKIPIKQKFNCSKKIEIDKWAHKYCPEWAWSENLKVRKQ